MLAHTVASSRPVSRAAPSPALFRSSLPSSSVNVGSPDRSARTTAAPGPSVPWAAASARSATTVTSSVPAYRPSSTPSAASESAREWQ